MSVSLKVVYEDIAVGAKEDSTSTSTDVKSFVDLDTLQDSGTAKNYAFCLPRYAKMTGIFDNTPDTEAWEGYISESITDSDGLFNVDPELLITFGSYYTSIGIGLTFNDFTGDYCNNISVTWYDGTTVLDSQSYLPLDSYYFVSNTVENFDSIKITFLGTSKPYRPAFLTKIDYGVEKTIERNSIKTLSCVQEVSPISEELSVNTLDFSFVNVDGIAYLFQEMQVARLYFGDSLVGKFYIQNGNRKSQKEYEASAIDGVGVLDGITYNGGIFSAYLLSTLLSDIFTGTGISYSLDSSYSGTTITGYLPVCTKREALQQIAFSIGAIIDSSNSEVVNITPIATVSSGTIEQSSIFDLSVYYDDIVTGVDVITHKYAQGTETADLYNDTLNGTETVYFTDPIHTLSITGGTIDESGVNYAVITGTGSTVVLSGYKYTDTTSLLSYRNASARGTENIITVEDATLVNPSNGSSVLTRVTDYYLDNKYIDADVILGDFQPAQLISIDTDFDGYFAGIITKANLSFGNQKIRAQIEVE